MGGWVSGEVGSMQVKDYGVAWDVFVVERLSVEACLGRFRSYLGWCDSLGLEQSLCSRAPPVVV